MDVNAAHMVGTHDIVLITLDTLRLDVAQEACESGRLPTLGALLPGGQWEHRHAPGTFTFASHAAFFAGFLPTPAKPGKHERLFAADFEGSETTGKNTCRFNTPDIVSGLRQRGYFTLCIGGVGFFNQRTPLGCVLPDLFEEAWWNEELGVTHRDSTKHQVQLAIARMKARAESERVFLFVNVSAIHQPNCMYVEGARSDCVETQLAALQYVDQELDVLLRFLKSRGPAIVIVTSDHGTAYGEDGFSGHRLSHPVILDVPYAEFVLQGSES